MTTCFITANAKTVYYNYLKAKEHVNAGASACLNEKIEVYLVTVQRLRGQ